MGGYFWVVFTSHRSYGNTLPSMDNGDEYGKLWVAAIDLNGAPGADLSHPAFYLDGQETKADNLRGFWVLDPCKQDGASCASGDECCNGFCRGGADGGLVCVPPPGSRNARKRQIAAIPQTSASTATARSSPIDVQVGRCAARVVCMNR